MTDLLPCPLCGGEAEVSQVFSTRGKPQEFIVCIRGSPCEIRMSRENWQALPRASGKVREIMEEMRAVMACNPPDDGGRWKTIRIKDWAARLEAIADEPKPCSICSNPASTPVCDECLDLVTRASPERLRALDNDELLEIAESGKAWEVREACRRRMPLDGADAQALEHAITITEQERDALRLKLDAANLDTEEAQMNKEAALNTMCQMQAERDAALEGEAKARTERGEWQALPRVSDDVQAVVREMHASRCSGAHDHRTSTLLACWINRLSREQHRGVVGQERDIALERAETAEQATAIGITANQALQTERNQALEGEAKARTERDALRAQLREARATARNAVIDTDKERGRADRLTQLGHAKKTEHDALAAENTRLKELEVRECGRCGASMDGVWNDTVTVEAARIGYMAGHDDTVESRYGDPDETAEDICRDLQDEVAPPTDKGEQRPRYNMPIHCRESGALEQAKRWRSLSALIEWAEEADERLRRLEP